MFESHLKPPISFPSVSGAVCSFDSQYAGLPLKSHTVEVNAVQSSGTPSPAYPLPISGWSAIHIQNTAGINQWDEQWENGYWNVVNAQPVVNFSYIRCKNFIRVLPNTTYRLVNTSTITRANEVLYFDADKTYLTDYDDVKGGETFTTPSNCYFIKFYMNINYGSTYNNDVSINFPATNTSYNAFVGQSITVQIGSTIYGGNYDAVSGVLTVTDKIIDLGNLSWGVSGSYFVSPYFALTDTNIIPPATNNDTLDGMCEVLNLTSYNNLADKCIALSSGKTLFAINSDYTDANDFKNSVTGHHLKYPLATPITIQLPPVRVETLGGVNNVFADTGDTTLQYIKFG